MYAHIHTHTHAHMYTHNVHTHTMYTSTLLAIVSGVISAPFPEQSLPLKKRQGRQHHYTTPIQTQLTTQVWTSLIFLHHTATNLLNVTEFGGHIRPNQTKTAPPLSVCTECLSVVQLCLSICTRPPTHKHLSRNTNDGTQVLICNFMSTL